MNRQERRKLKKQGIQVPKDPSINIKLSDMDDLYPERYKLKEKGIDIEKWQEEVLNNDP